MSTLTGRLTPAAAAQLAAVLGPLAKPKQTIEIGPRGGERQIPDPRAHEQRLHDALEDACARLLRTPGLPDSGGIPATVIITMTDDQLASKTGHADTSTGQNLTIPEALRIADQAQIIPTVLTGRGQPLWLGRTRRLATQAQTCALIARDGGCSFPGCSTRPEWCDRHHVIDWVSGGRTDINNLTLLCRYHHTHYLTAGWTCRITPDGLPGWAPPRWRDPDQNYLIHHRIRDRHRTRE